MRIYFCAAHSCGKTTLARITAEKTGLVFLNEVARTILAEKELSLDTLRVNLDVADDYQKTIFKRQIEEEKKHKSFVSDRTFDNLAYMAQHARMFKETVESELCKNYIESLKENDVTIFFIRPHKVTMKNDGVRESVSWDGIVAIDAQIKLLFELFGLDYFQINTDSMQERVRFVETVLKAKYKSENNTKTIID